MTPARRARASLTRTGLLAVLAGALLQACNFGEPTAGGSSEVDNPVVAMVDADGRRVNVTGSLGIYLSTQSPAVNPAPVLELQLNGVDSVVLSPKTFSLALAAAGYADSLHHLNLHLQAGDSSGAFLQRLTYDPARGSFSGPASTPDRLLKLTVSPLVDAGATIGGERDSGVQRLIIPGSPFQTVLVDSTFTFRNIPPGVFPLHLIKPDGRELPLPDSLTTDTPRHYHVNPDTAPVLRSPMPSLPLTVSAGMDRTVSAGNEVPLVADITGVSPHDKRLVVLWRQQTSENPGTAFATITNPTVPNTKVSFPRTGAYTFTITAVLGLQQVTDTVTIVVQAARSAPEFIEPGPGDTLHTYHEYGFRVVWWEDPAYDWWDMPDPLTLEFSPDSGTTWGSPPWDTLSMPLAGEIYSTPGVNHRYWPPVPPTFGTPPLENCFLRFMRNGDVVAVSGRFVLRTGP